MVRKKNKLLLGFGIILFLILLLVNLNFPQLSISGIMAVGSINSITITSQDFIIHFVNNPLGYGQHLKNPGTLGACLNCYDGHLIRKKTTQEQCNQYSEWWGISTSYYAPDRRCDINSLPLEKDIKITYDISVGMSSEWHDTTYNCPSDYSPPSISIASNYISFPVTEMKCRTPQGWVGYPQATYSLSGTVTLSKIVSPTPSLTCEDWDYYSSPPSSPYEQVNVDGLICYREKFEIQPEQPENITPGQPPAEENFRQKVEDFCQKIEKETELPCTTSIVLGALVVMFFIMALIALGKG